MKTHLIPVDIKSLTRLNIENEEVKALIDEAENGVQKADFELISFKIEQKIVNRTSSNALNIGGFVNGNSNIKNMSIRYLVTLYSNQFKLIPSHGAGYIRKRYGYGYGFTLHVKDIESNINANFSVVAAAATLNHAKVNYNINQYGAMSAKLAKYLPKENKTAFDIESFKQLKKFINEAKLELKKGNINKLYPIEVLDSSYDKLENSDTKSIYFGALKVKEGLSLEDAILEARTYKTFNVNENVIQFMYTYFGLDNAYLKPNSDQKQNARRWINGTYNKTNNDIFNNTSWVDIEPAVDSNGDFIVLSGTNFSNKYKPHPKPTDWANEAKLLKDEFSEVSLDFSTSLRIASTVDFSGKFNSVIINRTIALSTDVSDHGHEGSEVIETRYGVGIRLKVKISNIAMGTKVNYWVVGAASEMGHANVEYEISGIGISDTDFLSELPGPIDITQDSMSQIRNTFDNLTKKLASLDMKDLTPQPYSIKVSEPKEIDPTLKAQAVVFSIGKVAERTRLDEAIKEGMGLGIDKEDIIKAYKDEFEITELDERIAGSNKRDAKDWLLMRDEN